jgi:hypothetical protein
MKLDQRAQWSDEYEDWVIPHLQFTGNNLKNRQLNGQPIPVNYIYIKQI